LRSLSTQSLFPKVQSITLSRGKQKLFLSCNESGEWSKLKFSQESQTLRSLKKFDTAALLALLDSVRPLDVIPRAQMGNPMARETLSLEINGISRFEIMGIGLLDTGASAYLLPQEKHYGVVVSGDFLEKLLAIMEEISQDNLDLTPQN
jgi:hypothetical protein